MTPTTLLMTRSPVAFTARTFVFSLASSLTIAGASAAQQTAQPSPDQLRRADSLFADFTVRNSPGLAVAVVRGGKIVFTKGYGLANLEHEIPITPSTVFDVASVSKQFTGLAVAMLVQQGKVSLGDDIGIHPRTPDDAAADHR